MTINHAHTFIRCGKQIYRGINDQWQLLHDLPTEERAKRWEKDQNRKRPGSVEVRGIPPETPVSRAAHNVVQQELARRREISRLAAQQAADRAMTDKNSYRQRAEQLKYDSGLVKNRPGTDYMLKRGLQRAETGLSGKAAQLMGSYVAPDQGGSSFLRQRSKKREQSRSARNTRASFGGS